MTWHQQIVALNIARATAQQLHVDPRRFYEREVRDEWVDAWARFRSHHSRCSRVVQWWHRRTQGDPGDQPWPTTLAEFEKAYPEATVR